MRPTDSMLAPLSQWPAVVECTRRGCGRDRTTDKTSGGKECASHTGTQESKAVRAVHCHPRRDEGFQIGHELQRVGLVDRVARHGSISPNYRDTNLREELVVQIVLPP